MAKYKQIIKSSDHTESTVYTQLAQQLPLFKIFFGSLVVPFNELTFSEIIKLIVIFEILERADMIKIELSLSMLC